MMKKAESDITTCSNQVMFSNIPQIWDYGTVKRITEGSKMYVNNLLLFHATEYFKKMGCKWLDLGGIDYIDSEENARFKDGMRPRYIRLAGELIKF